jgi:hypothetical protein
VSHPVQEGWDFIKEVSAYLYQKDWSPQEKVGAFSLPTPLYLGLNLVLALARDGPHLMSHVSDMRQALSFTCSVWNHDSFINSVLRHGGQQSLTQREFDIIVRS